MIALHTTVHNGSIPLLPNSFSCRIDIDPIWIPPHSRIYLSKLDGSTCVIQDGLLKSRVEVSVVEEHIGVMEPPIEVPLHRFYRLDNPFQLLVPRQDHQYCVSSWSVCLRLKAAGNKHFVILLAYFPAPWSVYVSQHC